MSPQVTAASSASPADPDASVDFGTPAASVGVFSVLLLTKRRPIDFGLVATCLCCSA